jgi:peptidoglycan/xylan/chitin deacetylase (PgdA/CDA1 family)
MTKLRDNVIRASLGALYLTGAHRALRSICSGVGTIFMLHQVRPARGDAFQPNRHLEVTPEFLRATLAHLRAEGVDLVSLDEAHRRLTAHDFSRRFACFTLDDGYRDNRDIALPVFEAYEAPFTVYVTSEFAQGVGRMWWVSLERVIAKADEVGVEIGGTPLRLDTSDMAGKQSAFARLQDWIRRLPTEADLRREVGALCARHGVDDDALCAELCMPWDQLKPFSQHPLVTIGVHGISHCDLAKLDEASAAHELSFSRSWIEEALQQPAQHLAYPYGDKAAAGPREFQLAQGSGFKTAVTTRPGMLFPENADRLTALPRLSLNGNYQDTRLLPVLTSGVATAMWNGFRRVNAA